MNSRNRFSFYWCAPLFVLLFTFADSTPAQNKNQPDDRATVQALLNEVRLLRRTLERTGLNAYRSQLIVEGIRARNEKVVRLTRQLEALRDEMQKIEATIPRMTEQAKLTEEMMEQETDATKRIRLEFEAKDLRRSVEEYKIRLGQQKGREAQLSAQLRDEQLRLTDLEGRLDALEREIENEILRQQSEDASQEGKKPLL